MRPTRKAAESYMPSIPYPFGSVMQGRTWSSGGYRFGFNNQECDTEVNESYAFEYRIHYARLGRFLSVDPLSKSFPWNSAYAFAENKIIEAIDLEGLEAWEVNKTWTEEYIKLFNGSVGGIIQDKQKIGEKFTCDDISLEVIISFAKEHGLPFKWSTDAKEFDSESPEFSDYESFLLAVKSTSGAPDFAKDANTQSIGLNKSDMGTLAVMTSEGNELPNHIQNIVSTTKTEEGVVQNYSILQGNFRDEWWAGRWTGSDDPNSSRYLGTEIQDGIYFVDWDLYVNSTKGTETVNFSKEYSTEYRNFNFTGWNKKFEYKKEKGDCISAGYGAVGCDEQWVKKGEVER